jgi:hypothetical protein
MRDLLQTLFVFLMLMIGLTVIAVPVSYLLQVASRSTAAQGMYMRGSTEPSHKGGN